MSQRALNRWPSRFSRAQLGVGVQLAVFMPQGSLRPQQAGGHPRHPRSRAAAPQTPLWADRRPRSSGPRCVIAVHHVQTPRLYHLPRHPSDTAANPTHRTQPTDAVPWRNSKSSLQVDGDEARRVTQQRTVASNCLASVLAHAGGVELETESSSTPAIIRLSRSSGDTLTSELQERGHVCTSAESRVSPASETSSKQARALMPAGCRATSPD